MGSFPYRGVGLEGLGKRGQQAFPCLRLDSGAQVRPLHLMRPGLLVQGHQESQPVGSHAGGLWCLSLIHREALREQLLPAEQDGDTEGVCKPLSCGWEITDTLCVAPVFTPASIM